MLDSSFKEIIEKIKDYYREDIIPLHRPTFKGNELNYVNDAIKSTFVSSVGTYVNEFELNLSNYTSINKSVATVNGTSSLHIALILAGVEQNDEVITQSLTFVATANSIKYVNAIPVFIDVDFENFGMNHESLNNFLENYGEIRNGFTYNKITGNRIKACMPMHTFGFICEIEKIIKICKKWNIVVVEDCAEALGSFYKGKSAGKFGLISAFSFNGNKIITAGGGGAICSDNETIAKNAKHITTTAKKTHKWEYFHDQLGFNYRMPNLNAALLCAQLERINEIKENKIEYYNELKYCFSKIGIEIVSPRKSTDWNYWLFSLKFQNKYEKNLFLKYSHNHNVLCRPVWRLMNDLPMYRDCFVFDSLNSEKIQDTIVNIPSSEK